MLALTTPTVRMIVFGNAYWAPSRRMLTVARHVAAQWPEVEVEHVDVWQDPVRAIEHEVITVPTMIIVIGGAEQQRLCGSCSVRSLTGTIDRLIADWPARGTSAALDQHVRG